MLVCQQRVLLDRSIYLVYNQAQPIHEIEKVGTVELEVKSKAGHRERLKAHFIVGDDGAYTDETLLELLLTYAIPQRDVQPLAKKLLATFGSLSAVLSADIATLCKQEGIKEHSAVLLKLTDWIRKHGEQTAVEQAQRDTLTTPTLFPEVVPEDSRVQKVGAPTAGSLPILC